MQKAVFNSIESNIIAYLENAVDSIIIAVTWFTNKNLFDVILIKLNDKVAVQLILTSDDINFSEKALDYKGFIAKGGKLYVQDSTRLMHHKFCIIDDKILINGSYNWTQLAETSNNENVVIVEDEHVLISQFSEEFYRVANADGILVNAIPYFKSQPVFHQPVYVSIEYINNEKKLELESTDEPELIDNETFRVREIYSVQSYNGVRFIPMLIYSMNGVTINRVLYFAWEIEHNLSSIKTLKNEDFFSIGNYKGVLIDNRFDDFFWQVIGKIGNLYWELYRYRKIEKIPIGLFIKNGATVNDALKNLCYNLN